MGLPLRRTAIALGKRSRKRVGLMRVGLIGKRE